MATLTVRNLPAVVHRALRVRTAQRRRSTEAEIRAMLEEAVESPGRLTLGTWLANAGRTMRLTLGISFIHHWTLRSS